MDQEEESGPQSATAIGYAWSFRILSFSMEVALLAWGGHLLDEWFGTEPCFLLVGTGLGLIAFFTHLMNLVRAESR